MKLIPWFAQAVRQVIDEAIEEGVVDAVELVSGYRSTKDQRRLYNDYVAGRSDLPAAEPGTSFHEVGLAVDVAVSPPDALSDFGLFAESRGLRWGGRFGDPVHIDAGTITTLEEARVGFKPRQLMEV